MNTRDASEHIARTGYTRRLMRWGEARAAVRGEQYDDRVSWWACLDEHSQPILSKDRRPLVQLGEAMRLVGRVHDALVGTESKPAIEVYEGDDENARSDTEAAKAMAVVLETGLRLPDSLTLPALDLLIGGSCALGFSRPNPAKPEEHHFLRLQPEWCDVVFAPQAKTRRARAYAAQLAKFMEIPADEAGFFLPVPDDARPDDVVFLRYQVREVEEVPDGGGLATNTELTWHRTDWLPDAIISYEPVPATEGETGFLRSFKPLLPVDAHGWGLVPVVWVTEPMAEPGDMDGRSLLGPEALSMAEQADYLASFGTASANRNADPDVVEIDVEREDEAANVELQRTQTRPITRVTGGRSFRYRAIGDKPSVALLETTGEPVKAVQEQLRIIRQAIADNTGVTRHDPEKAAGIASGEAMKRMLQPFVSKVQAYQGILSAGLERLCEMEQRVLIQEQGIPAPDADLVLRAEWPNPTPLTSIDVKALAEAGAALVGAGYPQAEVVRYLAKELGDKDADEIVRMAEQDAEAKMQAARDAAMARAAQAGNAAQAQQPPEE